MLPGTQQLAQRAKAGLQHIGAVTTLLVIAPQRPFSGRAAATFTATALPPATHRAAVAAAAPPPALTAATAAADPSLTVLSFSERPGIFDSAGKLQLKNLTLDELKEWCASLGR